MAVIARLSGAHSAPALAALTFIVLHSVLSMIEYRLLYFDRHLQNEEEEEEEGHDDIELAAPCRTDSSSQIAMRWASHMRLSRRREADQLI
jgi:hypothetical protein